VPTLVERVEQSAIAGRHADLAVCYSGNLGARGAQDAQDLSRVEYRRVLRRRGKLNEKGALSVQLAKPDPSLTVQVGPKAEPAPLADPRKIPSPHPAPPTPYATPSQYVSQWRSLLGASAIFIGVAPARCDYSVRSVELFYRGSGDGVLRFLLGQPPPPCKAT
jgi:hypothetical protein